MYIVIYNHDSQNSFIFTDFKRCIHYFETLKEAEETAKINIGKDFYNYKIFKCE